MTLKPLAVAALAFGLVSVPAFGHHVSDLVDYEKTVEFSGTVKQFRWTNPHSFLHVITAGQDAKTVEWHLEMGSPGTLARAGWSPKTVAPGAKVTVKLHPFKDGSPEGQLLTVQMPDGTVKSGEAVVTRK